MSNYSTLKAAIQSAVYTNNNNEITGAGLQSVLLQIVNTIGDGYVFKGVATAGTAPGTPDENVFYIAPAGTYNNFGGSSTVKIGNIGVFSYNGTWAFMEIEVASKFIKSVIGTDDGINSTWLSEHPEITSVLDLPRNRIYQISNNVPTSFGLPLQTYATLLIYYPAVNQGNNGFTVYEYTCNKTETATSNIRKFIAYRYASTTELVWKEVFTTDMMGSGIFGTTEGITPEWLSTHPEIISVLDLPRNKIYQINNLVPITFGIPLQTWATLMVYYPAVNPSNNGFTVYEYTCFNAESASSSVRKFVAYRYANTTELVWKELTIEDMIESRAQMSAPEIYLDADFVVNNPEIDDFLKLTPNRTYRVQNTLPASFGLPVANKYGTLHVYTPKSATDVTYGYRVYDFTMIDSGINQFYKCYVTNSDTAGTAIWYKIGKSIAKTGKLRKLGINTTRVAFLGDSICAGYGSSDFNGGTEGTSGHLIPNDVRTFYRNTGSKCWVNQLIAHITANYDGAICVNNGINGLTVYQVYNNLSTIAVDDNNNIVDVVVLFIGTNSRTSEDKTASIITPLGSIAKWCNVRDIELIVLTNAPMKDQLIESNEYMLQSAILSACESYGIEHVNVLSEMNYYMDEHNLTLSDVLVDNIHPNDLGYEIMYKIIKRGLQL